MNRPSMRWALLALVGGLLSFIALRRRKQISAALPQLPQAWNAEHFVIPWPSLSRTEVAEPAHSAADPDDQPGSTQRTVSDARQIVVGGKLFGPLPAALIGQRVDIERTNGKLFVLHEQMPIATFDQE